MLRMLHDLVSRNPWFYTHVSFCGLALLFDLKFSIFPAETRKTYRAVFCEPELVIPEGHSAPQVPPARKNPTQSSITTSSSQPSTSLVGGQKKRPREENDAGYSSQVQSVAGAGTGQIERNDDKKKRKKNKT